MLHRGTVVGNPVAITGGTIDGTAIGGTTPAAGAFTTLSASGLVTASGATNGFVTDATNGLALFSGDPSQYNISRSGTDIQIKSASTIGALIAGTRILNVSSTGLAVTGTLSATGVATFSAGTVALPSITTSGDTNTGVYFPAADTVGITAGGTEQVRVNTTASATRFITLTGSNGGNPTIGTSAGNLTISSQIEAPVGTLTTPTYTFTGAQTTGVNYSGDGGLEIVATAVTQCTFKNNIGLRMLSSAPIGFASGTPTTTSIDIGIARKAAGILSIDATVAGNGLGAIHMAERTAPSAPAANGVYIYAQDNGAGKTQLMALFATGAAQQIAIEP